MPAKCLESSMGLSELYDAKYASDLDKGVFPEIVLRGWPRDRFQAIASVEAF